MITTLVEPRFYPNETPVTHDYYKKTQKSVNRDLKRRLKNRKFLNFNAPWWVDKLAGDGVHFDAEGKAYVRKRIVETIGNVLGDEESEDDSDWD